jgi:hypothetical protein
MDKLQLSYGYANTLSLKRKRQFAIDSELIGWLREAYEQSN